jgi:hypothetical protein
MDKEAELVFKTSLEGQHIINVPDPLDNLTLAAVTAVMNLIIDKNIFTTKTGELIGIVEARIHTSETVLLA